MILPEEWRSINDWDSHRPLLYTAVENLKGIDGHRIELGCGDGSTKLLRKYYESRGSVNTDGVMFLTGEHFTSFETHPIWAKDFPTIFIDSYLGYPFVMIENGCTLLFVDCAPGELRKHIIDAAKLLAQVIVIHDTEEGSEYVYGMKEVLSYFKFRLDYKPKGKPQTTAVSNYIDVSKWIIPE